MKYIFLNHSRCVILSSDWKNADSSSRLSGCALFKCPYPASSCKHCFYEL